MAKRFAKKKSWLVILLTFLLIGLIASTVVLFTRVDKVETKKEIGSSSFSVCALDDTDGSWEESQGSLVSDYIKVDGLSIEIKEDASISYKVFFYDEDHDFISKSDALTADFSGTIPSTAVYCRIEITPFEDSNISVFEKIGYCNQLTITVNK